MTTPSSPSPSPRLADDAPPSTVEPVSLPPAPFTPLSYDRAALTPSVVHLGVGDFHRAHQALYFDDLARQGISTEWGITGVGLHHPRVGQALAEQGNLYTVIVRGADSDQVRVVGAMIRYLFAPEDPEAVLQALADERTRLVTLTLGAAAYPDGARDADHEQARADVQQPQAPAQAPATAFGYLVEGLARRRSAGLPPFTVLSCDDVVHNGQATRRAVLSLARLRDEDLARWIEEEVAFPASVVDRITPVCTPQVQQEITREHHLGDRRPIVTEPFSQWIVEDDFCNGRPPLDQVGVQFTRQVGPHEVMKARLLEGAHSALGYLGSLAGFSTTDQAMADPRLRAYVQGYLAEASALLLCVPGIDLEEYCRSLVHRFSNPRVSEELSWLCRRGSTKVPHHVVPSLRLALDQDKPRRHLVLALAAWLRYLRGEDYAHEQIVLEDANAGRLQPLAARAGTDPRPLLAQHDLFGATGDDVRLTREVHEALCALEAGPLEAAESITRAAGVAARSAAA